MMPERKTRKAELTMRSLISVLTGSCAANEVPGVAVQEAREPVQYCEKTRAVEVQLLAQRLEAVGRRLAAEDRARRVAERLRRREDDRSRRSNEHEHAEQGAAEDEAPDPAELRNQGTRRPGRSGRPGRNEELRR